LRVQRDGRDFKVVVAPDGEGLVSHADSALLAGFADRSGLTRALSRELRGLKQRCSGHDLGHVVRDLAVMLADGGDCLADLGALGDHRCQLREGRAPLRCRRFTRILYLVPVTHRDHPSPALAFVAWRPPRLVVMSSAVLNVRPRRPAARPPHGAILCRLLADGVTARTRTEVEVQDNEDKCGVRCDHDLRKEFES
jgi:hypothetical protein